METGSESTAPFLDPTLGGLGLATAPGYPVYHARKISCDIIFSIRANPFDRVCPFRFFDICK